MFVMLISGLRHLSDVLPFCPQFYTSNFGRDILLDIKTAPPEPEIEVAVPQPTPKPNIELKIPNLPPGGYVHVH